MNNTCTDRREILEATSIQPRTSRLSSGHEKIHGWTRLEYRVCTVYTRATQSPPRVARAEKIAHRRMDAAISTTKSPSPGHSATGAERALTSTYRASPAPSGGGGACCGCSCAWCFLSGAEL